MKILPIFIAALITLSARAQIMTTVAGNGLPGYSGDGGPATAAAVGSNPYGITFDNLGNFYFGSYNRIRKVSPGGIITRFAGNGYAIYSGDGGPATAATLNDPRFLACDRYNNLYISDKDNHAIRKIDAISHIITTIAGTGTPGFSGDGGPATAAQFNTVMGICFDTSGNLYIADKVNRRIRKVDVSGNISTFAGNGAPGYGGDGGPATDATLQSLGSLCSDRESNIYLTTGYKIRKIESSTGIITTYAGALATIGTGDGGPATAAGINPTDIVMDANKNMFIGQATVSSSIKKVDSFGIITNYAGTGTSGFSGDGGPATAAQIWSPWSIALDPCENLYICDGGGNHRIRKIQSGATLPIATISVLPSDTVCLGTTATYTVSISGATPVNYQWYVNGAAITGATNSLYAYSPSNTDAVSCAAVVTGPCNVVNLLSNTINMVVNPIVTPTITVTPSPNDTVCAGIVVIFNSSVSGGGTGGSYQWYVNGVVVGAASSYSYTPANGDSIRCTYTSSSTCGGIVTISSNTINMMVNPVVVPAINITPSPNDTVCAGTIVTFSSMVTGGGTGSAYLWYVNGVTTGSVSSYSYTAANGDSIRCTYTSSSSCGGTVTISSNTINMVVNPLIIPTTTISEAPNDTVCAGTMVTFTAIVSGGSAMGYTWYMNGSAASAAGTTYTYVPASGDSVRCVVSSMEGCSGSPLTISSNTINMSVLATVVPSISITGISSAAVGSVVTVNATVSSTTVYTINWMNKGVLFNTTTVPFVTYTKTATMDSITAQVIPSDLVCYDVPTSNLHIVTPTKTTLDIIEPSLSLTIYPNPVKEQLEISATSGLSSITLVSLTGQTLTSTECYTNRATLKLGAIPAGVYLLKVTSNDGQQVMKRVVKEQ